MPLSPQFNQRIQLILNILGGVGSAGAGQGAVIQQGGAAAQQSTSALNSSVQESLRDTITFPVVIEVTKPNLTTETFNVTAALIGKEVYFGGTLVNGTTLIIAVTTT
jgi:hypothetical protein